MNLAFDVCMDIHNGSDCREMKEKVFNDAVHGAISLHPLCVKIIDTPEFQRLRFLKQVGSSYFVYPSAAHNRFEHCLGVCYLAGQLVRAIQLRQPDLGINSPDVLCVQIAGLCHDLGHGPFSHLWEKFVNDARPGKNWKHEEASVKMFDHLLKVNHLKEEFEKYNLFEKDILFIKEMINGPKKLAENKWPYEGRPKEKGFLYEVVANKRTGVDVDKWEYFMRDGHSLGIKVTFDYHRLVKFCRVIDVEGEGLQICFRDKECDNLYDMFHARRMLHRSAYQHRVSKTIDLMLVDAFCLADEQIKYRGEDGTKYALGDVCDDMSAFCSLTDEVFHRILLAEEEHPDLFRAKKILRNILKRQLYVYVGHTQPITNVIDQESLLNALLRNIPEGSSLSKDTLGIQQVTLSYGMGDINPIECVRFYNKASPDVAKVIRKEDVSAMLPQSFQEKVFRVVCKDHNEKTFIDAQKAFKDACKELNMREPSVDSWPNLLTPVKNKQHHTNGSVLTNVPAVKRLTF